MLKYTEQQLNAMTKTVLVSTLLELGIQLESFQSGPLKGSDVEKKMLDLARQASNIKSNDTARDQAHEIALAKIESDRLLAVKKLELEFADTRGLDAATLQSAYADIEAKSKLAIEDLSFGLKKAEVETQQKLEEINEKLDAAKLEYAEAIEKFKADLDEAGKKHSSEKSTLQINHDRTMEQVKYDNKISLRDENLTTAEHIASIYSKVIVDSDEYNQLQAVEKKETAEVDTLIANAVKAAKSEVYTEQGAKYSNLKSATDSQIALLENDKRYLTTTISTLENRLTELTEQVKAFPAQIKDAVAASKADITVNQDANKK